MRAVILFALMLAGCASGPCDCKKPENPHLTLQLPPSLDCKIEGADHVCVTKDRSRYVIYTVKPRGKDDTLASYQARFMNSRLREINGQQWVDAVRNPGELPGYVTRYLATADGDNVALVTLTGRDRDFDDFNEDMDDVISALVLRR